MMQIRQAISADVGELIRLNNFVHKLHVAAHPHIFKPIESNKSAESFFDSLFADVNNHVYLANVDNAAAGYLWMDIRTRDENALMHAQTRAYIHHIAVDEAFRRRGVATALIKQATAVAKEAGCLTIMLDVWAFNREAQTFFEGEGFTTFNTRMWKMI